MIDLPDDAVEALAVLDAEALARCTLSGKTDHVLAARNVQVELERLDGGGVAWAGHVRDRAEVDGHIKRLKSKAKARTAKLPTSSGAVVTIPTAYSRRGDDGSVQLALWIELPLEDLESLIDDLFAQARVLTQRALVMRYGLELAVKHGAATAAAGFAAEGIDIGEVAA